MTESCRSDACLSLGLRRLESDPSLICLLEWTLVLVSVSTLILAASDLVPASWHFRAFLVVWLAATPRFKHLRWRLTSAPGFRAFFSGLLIGLSMTFLGRNEVNYLFLVLEACLDGVRTIQVISLLLSLTLFLSRSFYFFLSLPKGARTC